MHKHTWKFLDVQDSEKAIYWSGICRNDRIPAISNLASVIGKYGFITDFKEFSDISIAFRIEIISAKLEGLFNALKECLQLDGIYMEVFRGEAERVVFLNVTFTGAQGDLRIETPAVPG